MAVIVQDLFNDVNGTTLDAHTPDVGGVWDSTFAGASRVELVDGYARLEQFSTTSQDVIPAVGCVAVEVQFIAQIPTPASNENSFSLYIKETDLGNFSGVEVEYYLYGAGGATPWAGKSQLTLRVDAVDFSTSFYDETGYISGLENQVNTLRVEYDPATSTTVVKLNGVVQLTSTAVAPMAALDSTGFLLRALSTVDQPLVDRIRILSFNAEDATVPPVVSLTDSTGGFGGGGATGDAPAVTYPASLPNPTRWTVKPRERNQLSRIREPSDRSRNRGGNWAGIVSAEWMYLADEMEVWHPWYETNLVKGQKWFVMYAPTARGWVLIEVRYLLDTMRRDYMGNGVFRIASDVEVRSISLIPSDYLHGLFVGGPGGSAKGTPLTITPPPPPPPPPAGIFVAVANGGGDRVMVSTDGQLWTSRTGAPVQAWVDVTYSPELGLFCAVGAGNPAVMTSPDTITWTTRTAAALVAWVGVAWSPTLGLFAAVAFQGNIMTSPDGITWTSRTPPLASMPFSAIIWVPELGMFVATSTDGSTNDGNQIATSTDGITWTARATPVNGSFPSIGMGWRELTWSPSLGLIVAVSQGTAISGAVQIMTSPDGINWTARTSPDPNLFWTAVQWASQLGKFAAVSQGNGSGVGANRVMTSPDGINWTQQTLDASLELQWRALRWNGTRFVAVANSGVNRVMSSTDGVTWTQETPSADSNWIGLCWAVGNFL